MAELVREEGKRKAPHFHARPMYKLLGSYCSWVLTFVEHLSCWGCVKLRVLSGGSCLSVWKEVVCLWIMNTGLGTGKIHTWCSLPRALLG